MLLDEHPVRGEVEQRVVDRSALPLVDPDHEPHAGFASDAAEAVRRRARYHHRLVGQHRVPLVVPVPDPCGVDPHRRPRDESLRRKQGPVVEGESKPLGCYQSGPVRTLDDGLVAAGRHPRATRS